MSSAKVSHTVDPRTRDNPNPSAAQKISAPDQFVAPRASVERFALASERKPFNKKNSDLPLANGQSREGFDFMQ